MYKNIYYHSRDNVLQLLHGWYVVFIALLKIVEHLWRGSWKASSVHESAENTCNTIVNSVRVTYIS